MWAWPGRIAMSPRRRAVGTRQHHASGAIAWAGTPRGRSTPCAGRLDRRDWHHETWGSRRGETVSHIRGSVLAMLCAASLPALAADAERPAPAPTDKIAGAYLVFMSDDPVVTYHGGVSRARPNRRDRRRHARPQLTKQWPAYASHLLTGTTWCSPGWRRPRLPSSTTTLLRQRLRRIADPVRSCGDRYAAGVLAIVHDELRRPATDSTPDFLGLTDPRGPWATGYTGEGVVIGVIDTGHLARACELRRRWHDTARWWTASRAGVRVRQRPRRCAVRMRRQGRRAPRPSTPDSPPIPSRVIAASDHLSTRDATGHGSHTAATAAGNQSVRLGTRVGRRPEVVSGYRPTCPDRGLQGVLAVGAEPSGAP